MAAADPLPGPAQPAGGTEEDGTEPPKRILVVEDEEDMAALLGRALRRRGFQVDLAGNGAEALEALGSHRYALLIADIVMPRMSGLHLAEIAGRRWPQMPVILITGLADGQSYTRAMNLNVAEYLSKPIRIGRLLAVVERALDPPLPA